MTRETIERFFEEYGDALSSGDLRAIVACFDPPTFMVDDVRTTLMVDHRELSAYFEGIEQRYRALGAFTASAVVGRIEQLAPALWIVDVRWDSFDESGAPARVEVERYSYLLRTGRPAEPLIAGAVVTE